MADWPSVLSAVAAGAACWAAWESRRSANAARRAVEAQVLKSFLDEYAQPVMSDALRALRDWKDTHKEHFAQHWLSQLEAEDAEAKRVDVARRHVKAFFVNATRMHLGGLIDETLFRHAVERQGLNIYLDVVGPLEDVLNPGRDRTPEERVRAIVGRDSHQKPRA